MQSNPDNRVLGRARAREITKQELESIHGGFNTFVCTFNINTGAKDGDACW